MSGLNRKLTDTGWSVDTDTDADKDRKTFQIHEIWRASNPLKKGEDEQKYIDYSLSIYKGIKSALLRNMSEKDIKTSLGLKGGRRRKTKRRKTRRNKTKRRRYRK
jgi:hypothetical protein